MPIVKVIAPAKVNLFLQVGGLRPDGYHDVVNVMHAISLHDTLTMRRPAPTDPDPEEGGAPSVSCTWAEGLEPTEIPSGENLAARAVRLLAEKLGRRDAAEIVIEIDKHIPLQAGLGGGSSDAAAALVGAAYLWGVDPADPAIAEAARELGSDVPFFLQGGCALFGGRGDELLRTLEPSKGFVTLIFPEAGISTAAAYRRFDENPVSLPDAVLARVEAALDAVDVPLGNALAPAAEELLPQLAGIRSWAEGRPGVEGVLLTGSGAATFALCRDYEAAVALSTAARREGRWSRVASLTSIGAAIRRS